MLVAGESVGRYRALHPVGRGGMAEVWAVEHAELGTRHALKILRTQRPGLRERFLREGRLQARLDPAHVIPVTEVLEVRGAPALLMPLVDGCSLAALLEAHRPDEDDAIAIVAGILRGVAVAHAAGVVHRDLKPANVLLEPRRGRIVPRVVDFGIAKERGAVSAVETVAFLGTPAYAAPEQLDDAAGVDGRADLWSVGVVLYELLAGRRPFEGTSVAAVLYAVHRQPLDLAPIPPRWRPVVAALLEPEVERRPPSAAAVLDRLPTAPTALRLGTPLAHALKRLRDRSREAANRWTQTHARAAAEPPSTPRLPVETDTFVGRTEDLARLADALQRDRVVSVLGIGGAGKTRLIVHYAHRHHGDWPGGVWFCDLSAARGPEGVLQAVARGLEVPLAAGDPALQLGHALAARGRALLLVDNAEQVAPDVAALLERWLGHAPQVSFAVTSRRRLGVAGERTLELQPLDRAAAIELFTTRAASARQGGYLPSPDDREVIAELVSLLDGLPLALELAAARVRSMAPRRILERMTDRFRILSSRSSDRHATLRATLDESWELLSATERACLAQLAVFRGGFDLEAAEAVLAIDDGWVLGSVEALVDHSLVRVVRAGRFALWMSVQQYALEKLEVTTRVAAEARHGHFFAELGTPEALRACDGHGGVDRRQALAAELDNLVEASQLARDRGEMQVAAACAVAASRVLQIQGPIELAVQLLEGLDDPRATEAHIQALCAAGRASDALPLAEEAAEERPTATSLRLLGACLHHLGRMDEARAASERALSLGADAATLQQLGSLHHEQGRVAEARSCFERALTRIVETGDLRRRAAVLGDLAALDAETGQLEDAVAAVDQALAIAREVADRAGEARLLLIAGSAEEDLGELDEAQRLLEQSLAIFRAIGARRDEAMALGSLGGVYQSARRYGEAQQALEASLGISREQGNRYAEGVLLGNLAIVYGRVGLLERSLEAYEEALVVHREVGNRTSEAICRSNLGARLLLVGRPDEARRHFEAARAAFRELQHPRDEAIVTGHLVELLVDRGQPEEALALADAALTVLRRIGDRRFEAVVLGSRGRALRETGALEEARSCFVKAARIARDTRDPSEEIRMLCDLASLDLRAGDEAAADERIEAAEARVRDIDDPALQAGVCRVRGDYHRVRGDRGRARVSYDASEALLHRVAAKAPWVRLLCGRALLERDPEPWERAAVLLAELGLDARSPLGTLVEETAASLRSG